MFKAFFFPFFLFIAAGTGFGSTGGLLSKDYLPIERFYALCNFVATHGAWDGKRSSADFHLQSNGQAPEVLKAIREISTFMLSMDPRMIHGYKATPDLRSTYSPLEVVHQSGSDLVLKILKQPVSRGSLMTPADPRNRLNGGHFQDGGGTVQFDYWRRSDDGWKISDIHGFYLDPG